MDVTLKTEVTSLSEVVVVVVGYTKKRKKDLTGAVSIVNTEQMQQLPTTQLTVQMQGRASSVMILGSEQPGEGIRKLLQLDAIYQNSSIESKRKLIGSIYPENFIFDGANFRTTRMNETVRLVY